MSDFIPKAPAPKTGTLKIGGLGPKAQKLQAAREKAANANSGNKPAANSNTAAPKASSLAGHKKTSFQRKAV